MTDIEDRIYIKYAYDCLDGTIVACKNIKMACQRFIDWFKRDDIYFDYADVDKKIRIVSKLKHSTGSNFNGKPFILSPWQQFIFANIFGWKWKETNLRVTENVFVMVGRKNGKTALMAALSLVCTFADNEPNAEIDLVANNRQQATIAFDSCSNFAQSVDPSQSLFRTLKSNIQVPRTKSMIQVLSSDSMGLDGYNSHVFILDEFHSQRDWRLYNVMKSSQGMRQQPLAIIITTAGYRLDGFPCFEHRKVCIDILRGIKKDDSQFSAIYELDEDDDWKNEDVWIKSLPGLDVTVQRKYIRGEVARASNNKALEAEVKTKHFNMFCQSGEAWLDNVTLVEASQHLNYDDFKDEVAYMGVDLSVTHDLTAYAILFPPNKHRRVLPDKFVFFVRLYIPECTFDESVNAELYKGWCSEGYAKKTEGNAVDYDKILNDQIDDVKTINIINILYDKYNATQWAINATDKGLPIQPFSQGLGSFNMATKQFEILLRKGDIVIDDNPLIRWCLLNCELKFDHADNCKPVKAAGIKSNKIDAAIAMLQALGGYLNDPDYSFLPFTI